MSYRIRPAIGALALLVLLIVTPASAEMRGNVYSSHLHDVTFARPDGSWELRNHPAHENGVALFSNGEGTVIALLLHQAIAPRNVISSVGELGTQWPKLANQIAAMSNAGQSGVTVTESRYEATNDQIEFEIYFSSTLPNGHTSLTNWLRGMIVRDTEDRQHLYAIRCAAADGVFSAWETQFELIMPTLAYTGSTATPVYTGKPFSYWWYGGGVVALLLLFMFFRRGSDTSDEIVRRRPARTQPQQGAVTQPMPAAGQPPLTPAKLSESGPIPTDDSSPTPEELMNVPESFYYQNAQGQGAGHEHPDVAPGGPASTGGFWKCTCGRVNPGAESYCARCNADRPNDA
ncbi:MAG: hypothetical protein GF341_02760 [candidate division Zixibacteria bacterium]|nr:hypothetical protein [candidate division Zixibacteria bacterium]